MAHGEGNFGPNSWMTPPHTLARGGRGRGGGPTSPEEAALIWRLNSTSRLFLRSPIEREVRPAFD